MNNQNLLSIEEAFLSNAEVTTGLGLNAISEVQTTLLNASKSKFAGTIKMAALAINAVNFYESEGGKALFIEEGITWTKADLGLKVFGWQKSFFYKVIKAGKLDPRIVSVFQAKCLAARDASMSIANLLAFAKTINLDELQHDAGMSDEAIEAAEAEVIEAAEVEAPLETEPTILTFSFKNPAGKNVSVRVLAGGDVITTNETDEVRQAAKFLMAAVQSQQ
jgi:hypothetical protein|tara:strand:- start:643 stop:1305 length:663 start_codon:yes stop_codon:yes gene_type:complete